MHNVVLKHILTSANDTYHLELDFSLNCILDRENILSVKNVCASGILLRQNDLDCPSVMQNYDLVLYGLRHSMIFGTCVIRQKNLSQRDVLCFSRCF